MNGNDKNKPNPAPTSISRRGFIGGIAAVGSAAVGTAALSSMAKASAPAAAAPPKKPVLVIINLRGGNDGLNTIVPFTLKSYYKRRPTLAIAETSLVSLGTGPAANKLYGLHPALPKMGAMYTAGDMAIVNKVGYPKPNLSHFTSMDIWARGYRFTPVAPGRESGWIARLNDTYIKQALGVVGIKTGKLLDFRGGTIPSIQLNSVADYGFDLDYRYKNNSRFRNQVIREIVADNQLADAGGEVRDAIDLAYENITKLQNSAKSYSSAVTYPGSSLGQALRESAILLSTAFPTQVILTTTGGYDTHSNQAGRHQSLLSNLDNSVGAFATDLKNKGLWDDLVIAVISEFGRRSFENGSKGTDHGSGSIVMLMGGGVKGGVFGPDLKDADINAAHPPFAVDFRQIWWEVIGKHLKFDPNPLFPEKPSSTSALGVIE